MAKKQHPSETPSVQPGNRWLVDFEVTVYSTLEGLTHSETILTGPNISIIAEIWINNRSECKQSKASNK
jgi:hypothetical protein